MDSISDSDSEDAGSIPAGTTNKADPEATESRRSFAGGLLQGRFIFQHPKSPATAYNTLPETYTLNTFSSTPG